MIFEILKDFKGSHDGRFTESFEAGTERELSESLASVAVREGWARPAGVIENKAVVSDGSNPKIRRSKK